MTGQVSPVKWYACGNNFGRLGSDYGDDRQ